MSIEDVKIKGKYICFGDYPLVLTGIDCITCKRYSKDPKYYSLVYVSDKEFYEYNLGTDNAEQVVELSSLLYDQIREVKGCDRYVNFDDVLLVNKDKVKTIEKHIFSCRLRFYDNHYQSWPRANYQELKNGIQSVELNGEK